MAAEGIVKPNSKLLNTIINNNEFVVINNNKLKFSELLQLFISPILKNTDDFDMVKAKLHFGIKTWNAAVVREKSEDEYLNLKKEFLHTFNNLPNIEEMFDELVNQKQNDFNAFKVLFTDFDLTLINQTECNLTVVVSVEL